MSEQEKDMGQVSKDLGDEAQALNEMADQGLSPEDQATWDGLVQEHKEHYDQNAKELNEWTKKQLDRQDDDRRYRVESGDHNAR